MGARIAYVLPGAARDPLGPGLEDEPLDRVGDREVQGQRRGTQASLSAGLHASQPGSGRPSAYCPDLAVKSIPGFT